MLVLVCVCWSDAHTVGLCVQTAGRRGGDHTTDTRTLITRTTQQQQPPSPQKGLPNDNMILTLGCGKFRFIDHDFGSLPNGLPRLLDMGQW